MGILPSGVNFVFFKSSFLVRDESHAKKLEVDYNRLTDTGTFIFVALLNFLNLIKWNYLNCFGD